MKNDELDDVMKIWENENPNVHSFLDDEFLASSINKAEEIIKRSKVFVAEKEDKIVGFTALSGNFVEYLFVSSDFQKQGIGKALLKHVKNIFWSLMIKVYQKNNSAVSFFEKQFFFVRDKMDNADTGECELCMEWIR